MEQLANQLFKASGRYMHTIMTNDSLPQGQMFALMYLEQNREQPVTPTDLSQEMNVRPPTITPLIRRLERKGFLRRVHSREDRRRVDLSITPEGREALALARRELLKFYSGLLTRLSREEGETLVCLLEKISDPVPHSIRKKGTDL